MNMSLEQEFHTAMIEEVYRAALRKHHYSAKLFLEMVGRDGGSQTAKNLLASMAPQYGFTELWERGGLDSTMEHLVLQAKWRSLFSQAELQEAEKRLSAYATKHPGGNNPYANHVCTASICPL
jgi:hypothetical protein